MLALALALMLAPILGLAPREAVPTASAHCNGNVVKGAVGGKENTNYHRGTSANILVNNFTTHQYQTWRMAAVVENSNNYAEAGWSQIEAYGSNAFPMKVWVDNGVKDWQYFTGVSLSRGVRHEFKTHDSDGNWYWSFAYNGNSMGNEYVSFSNGVSVTESERWCTTDVLFAEFRSLQRCHGASCGWTNYQSLVEYINNTNDYKFCKLSTTSYDVKGQC